MLRDMLDFGQVVGGADAVGRAGGNGFGARRGQNGVRGADGAIAERAGDWRISKACARREADVAQFIEFHAGAANFPSRSQGAWIGSALAQRYGLARSQAIDRGRATYRSDSFRTHLASETVDLPAASGKAEGLLAAPMPVPPMRGSLILGRNPFFDGKIFDPANAV